MGLMSEEAAGASRFERVLAYLIVVIIAVSVLAFFAVLITSMFSMDLTAGLWPAVTMISYIGLPIGFLLIVVLLFTTMRRRKKANALDVRR